MSFIPAFESGLILKKHMLESLRDYPISYVNTLFSEYGDGVITGLKVMILDNDYYEISEGIVKINGNVYLVNKSNKIAFSEQRNYVYLQLVENKCIDGVSYDFEIIDSDTEIEDGFELFRYTKNATMKYYEDIDELFGEITNRVDQRNMRQSLKGGYSLAEQYYVLYAKKILHGSNFGMKDVSFAYQCLNGITNIEIVLSYFGINKSNNVAVIAEMKKNIKGLETTVETVTPKKDDSDETEKISVYIS